MCFTTSICTFWNFRPNYLMYTVVKPWVGIFGGGGGEDFAHHLWFAFGSCPKEKPVLIFFVINKWTKCGYLAPRLYHYRYNTHFSFLDISACGGNNVMEVKRPLYSVGLLFFPIISYSQQRNTKRSINREFFKLLWMKTPKVIITSFLLLL